MKRILIIFANFIGDTILFSPVVQQLKKIDASITIDLVIDRYSQELVTFLPEVDNIITCDLIKPRHSNPFLQKILKLISIFHVFLILRKNKYDCLIFGNLGKSFMISCLLMMTKFLKIKNKIGFDTMPCFNFFLTDKVSSKDKYCVYFSKVYMRLVEKYADIYTCVMDNTLKAIPQFYFLNKESFSQLDKLSNYLSLEKRFIIHPGFSSYNKTMKILKHWPYKEWTLLIQKLLSTYPDANIYIMGTDDDTESVNKIKEFCLANDSESYSRIVDFTDKKLKLKDYALLLSASDVFITNDTGPMHLAVAIGIPVVAIFTCTSENAYLPQEKQLFPVYKNDLECRPCINVYRATSCNTPICREVGHLQVFETVQKCLKLFNRSYALENSTKPGRWPTDYEITT